MLKDLQTRPKTPRRTLRVWFIALVIGLALFFTGFALFPDGFFQSLAFGIPMGLLALFFGGIWYLIRMTARSQSTPSVSSDVGWSLFGSCGLLCAVIGTLIFFAPGGGGGGESQYWIGAIFFGLFFGLPCLLACLGLIQIVGGMPFTRIPRNWNRLGSVRRLLLVTIVMGTACVVILCVYYLVELNVTCTNAAQPVE